MDDSNELSQSNDFSQSPAIIPDDMWSLLIRIGGVNLKIGSVPFGKLPTLISECNQPEILRTLACTSLYTFYQQQIDDFDKIHHRTMMALDRSEYYFELVPEMTLPVTCMYMLDLELGAHNRYLMIKSQLTPDHILFRSAKHRQKWLNHIENLGENTSSSKFQQTLTALKTFQ